MRVSFRRLMEILRFFLLFVTCALLSYGIISLLSDRFLPGDPYREPHGNAVKVVKLINAQGGGSWDGYLSRLQLFYLTGE
ncbi:MULTISPECIES: YqzK family protein [Bacillales]|mgnify:CR=1 FL=1|uniref:DUF4227 domain-containing protein n=1 Tax=Brevibacillus aydinogluensis TaxID=927786 RepID=A0AA48M951_9BACL|nr:MULTISPECIES: YqzK family protein [Bacillales]REK62309.1 MAG: DUF4227 domain-containing protein [Brevibacillus sp.]MBR8659256.1 YqzK family protein [Brevibacillus sp. NL20B1]MDT3415288.1 hypothetical protein [Brevibacillus aydinogluensis]NNV02698.1 DUF4227 family protein [Brevibacillus sp. MCWH]UFJ60379.1 YqzK family protein [Anoxybacillus sediminis]